MAAHLLTHPTSPAAHCMVIDTGLREADGGGGYDTHNETPFTQARNLNNFFNSLLPLVNKPGETDPNKIDLNKTMIILNMEFGRTPGLQKTTNTGRNHWPYGYTQVYIGGPITKAQRGVYGAIPESGHGDRVHHADRKSHRCLARDGHLALRSSELQQRTTSKIRVPRATQ